MLGKIGELALWVWRRLSDFFTAQSIWDVLFPGTPLGQFIGALVGLGTSYIAANDVPLWAALLFGAIVYWLIGAGSYFIRELKAPRGDLAAKPHPPYDAVILQRQHIARTKWDALDLRQKEILKHYLICGRTNDKQMNEHLRSLGFYAEGSPFESVEATGFVERDFTSPKGIKDEWKGLIQELINDDKNEEHEGVGTAKMLSFIREKGEDIFRSPVKSEQDLITFKDKVKFWYNASLNYIANNVNQEDSILFTSTRNSPSKSYTGTYNNEHKDFLHQLDTALQQLEIISKKHSTGKSFILTPEDRHRMSEQFKAMSKS